MGNENKVSGDSLIKAEFLPDKFIDKDKDKVYSLENEFKAASKNKNIGVYFIVFLFLAVLLGASILTSYFVRSYYENQELEFGTIEQLNLQELLSTTKKNEQKLAGLESELSNLRDKMNTAETKAATAAEKKRIRDRYSPLIETKQTEIAELKKEMEARDLELKESMRHADEMINNYKKLSDIQIEKQKEEFAAQLDETVLKYNPVFTEEENKTLMSAKGVINKTFAGLTTGADSVAGSGISEADYAELKKLIQNRADLMRRVKQIPYINSASASMKRLDELDSAILSIYEKSRANAVKSYSKSKSYNYVLNNYAGQQGGAGFIMDPRNGGSIDIFITSAHNVQAGDIASVVRGAEPIGTIEFTSGGNPATAQIASLMTGKTFLPMDKIVNIVAMHKNEPPPEPEPESSDEKQTSDSGNTDAGAPKEEQNNGEQAAPEQPTPAIEEQDTGGAESAQQPEAGGE